MEDCEIRLIPCKICGLATSMLKTKLCNNCWEVISRLEDFVTAEKGYTFVKNVIRLQDKRTADLFIEMQIENKKLKEKLEVGRL